MRLKQQSDESTIRACASGASAASIKKECQKMSKDYFENFTTKDYYAIKAVDRRLVNCCSLGFFCDVGGAGGIDAIRLGGQGVPGVCLDVDKNAMRKGKQLAERLGVDVEFVVASAKHLPFMENCFDLVLCFSVIDHLPGKQAAAYAVKEFSRIVKPLGFVAVTVPNKLFLVGTLMNWLLSVFGSLQEEERLDEQRFTCKELADYFGKCGLSVFKYDSQFPIVVGSAVLKFNLPTIILKVPLPMLKALFVFGAGIFSFADKHLPTRLLGARFGAAAVKSV